jgi:hypothetical protein
MGSVTISLEDHLRVAFTRAEAARAEARALVEAGFPGAGLIWAVRATEILMRDFLLAPHFLEEGEAWERAMRKASRVLGDSDWRRAFARVEERYGPFDEPLLEDGSNAWQFWHGVIIRRRGDIVHGRAVPEVEADEAFEACDFADRMASWFAQRFLTSPTHPIGRQFRTALEALTKASQAER